ncbi:PAS domain-containing protein [Bacillus swezeyi]|uniref:STAS domain-containing protein n=1 Tax=Bacillus swezeyi TaxID=1925020 RepID=UPI002E247EFB|nr:PAS domain-containing protein [Bacillus swezeyi]
MHQTSANLLYKLNLLKKAVDHMKMGLTITDPSLPDHPIIFVNKGFLQLTGYSEEEAVGRNCRFLQGNDSNRSELEKVRRAIKKEESAAVQLKNYKKDGTMFWNEVVIEPLRFTEGGKEKLYFIGFQKDVTSEREQQKQLSNSLDEVLAISTPIVPVKDGISILPVIGTLTEQRFQNMLEKVSTYIMHSKDDYFIIDLSGLLGIDTFVADAIFKLHDLISLTGTEFLVTGIQTDLAMKMAELRVDFDGLKTYMNVKAALEHIQF